MKATFVHHGRRIYVHHFVGTAGPGRPLDGAPVCDASGWLVEDDELLDRTPPPPPQNRTKRETT